MSQEPIRIGVLATLVGPYQTMGEDSMRGADLALAEFGGKVAGRRVLLYKQGSNAIPDSAVSIVDTLLNKDGVDFVIGPLSGNEGLAVRDYARLHPDRAFINGLAGSQDMTLRDHAPNFFNFATNGVQWTAGLGKFAYEDLGYRRIVTLAEDYSYPHGQIAGFKLEYCRAGGKIVDHFWVSLGTSDYRMLIKALPPDIDAVFVALGGTDAVSFITQYEESGGVIPVIGGSLTADQTVLSTTGILLENLIGVPTAGPVADDNPSPAWQAFVTAYRSRFKDGMWSPSLFAYGYYVNTIAALLALEQVNGDLSEGQTRFQAALRHLVMNTPTGKVRLDTHGQAIGTNFVTVVTLDPHGHLYRHLVRVIPEVQQTLGIPEEEYLQMGIFSRKNLPPCN